MISTKIIEGLKAHEKEGEFDVSPEYFIAINDITQKHECNQDSVEFTLYQINKSLSEVLSENKHYAKKFIISGSMELDDAGLYFSKLIGYENNIQIPEPENYINNSHHIEVIETKLNKEIDIEFEEEYEVIPSVIINIDNQYKKLYRNYNTDLIKNKDKKFTGVKITFNSLKSKREYPLIKITIIGDENSDFEESD